MTDMGKGRTKNREGCREKAVAHPLGEIDIMPLTSKTSPMTDSHRTKSCLSVILALAVTLLPTLAEDWTVNGKTYHNVKITKVEPDRVHFTADDGVGSFAIADLTPELQKRFGYDPQKAKASADVRAKASAEAQQEIAAELAAKQASQNTAHKSLKPDQVAAIQAKIDRLESDIRQCQQKQATLTKQELQGSGWQYGEEIRQDKVAINALEAQLQ
jgi:hypothetical protein